MNYIDYKEIKLGNNKSLYYTNKKISNKIIIDLKANPYNYKLNLNLKKTNAICSYLEKYIDELVDKCKKYDYYEIDSYIKIDNWNYNSFLLDSLPSSKKIDGELSLLGITYFGFDPSAIKKRKEIQIIKSNLLTFKSFYILKLIFFVLSPLTGIIFCIRSFHPATLIFLIPTLFQIIMNLISLIVRINTIHNFIFKIIYKNKGEDEDYKYKNLISIYIITLLIFSSKFLQALYVIIKDIFKLKDFVTIKIYPKRSKDNNPTRNNDKRNDKGNDNPNTERININKQIDQDNNNNNNKNKQKEEMKSPQTIIINNKNKTNNNIKKPKERNENSELLITNNKNEINNYIDKPKEITEYPEPLDINNKNKIEATDIKFPKK